MDEFRIAVFKHLLMLQATFKNTMYRWLFSLLENTFTQQLTRCK